MKQSILITGGAGFIGSHLVKRFVNTYPDYQIINLDKLTYAGNLKNLQELEGTANYEFIKGDILDDVLLRNIFEQYQITKVIHLAAESHVDRSILNPLDFVQTNVLGTVTLLNQCKNAWKDQSDVLFYHVSTDEVYGSLAEEGFFVESSPYDPRSPYSASKASSDHFVRAYGATFGLPFLISNCSNNYGPYQFPEKLIPLFIQNIIQQKDLPVYGKGENIRDWLWVGDHCEAIDQLFHKGRAGETYVIGGRNEWRNIDLVEFLCDEMDKALGRPLGSSRDLITFVKDRAGHDQRYAILPEKIRKEFDWEPSLTFEEGLRNTIQWYLHHQDWLDEVKSGAYQEYYDQQYSGR